MRQGALLVTAPEYALPWAGLTRSPTAVLESVSTTCGVTRQKSDNQEGELWEAEMPVQTGRGAGAGVGSNTLGRTRRGSTAAFRQVSGFAPSGLAFQGFGTASSGGSAFRREVAVQEA